MSCSIKVPAVVIHHSCHFLSIIRLGVCKMAQLSSRRIHTQSDEFSKRIANLRYNASAKILPVALEK